MAYKRLLVAQHFGKDTETIRRWSIEFSKHLSQGTNTEGRNKSLYTDEDIETLSLIHTMYDTGHSTEDIRERLEKGEKGIFDGILENKRITLNAVQTTEFNKAMQELEEAKQTIIELRVRLGDFQAGQKEIRTLNQEIGALKYQLEQALKEAPVIVCIYNKTNHKRLVGVGHPAAMPLLIGYMDRQGRQLTKFSLLIEGETIEVYAFAPDRTAPEEQKALEEFIKSHFSALLEGNLFEIQDRNNQ
jgi:DNA-binding transcriptional MerR regulator